MSGVSRLLGGVQAFGADHRVHRRVPGTPAGSAYSEAGAASLMLIADRSAGVGVVEVGDDPCAAGKKAAGGPSKHLDGKATALLTLAFMGAGRRSWKRMDDCRSGRAGGRRLAIGSLPRQGEFRAVRQGTGHAYKNHFAITAMGQAYQIGYAFTNGYRLTGQEGHRHQGLWTHPVGFQQAVSGDGTVYCGVGRASETMPKWAAAPGLSSASRLRPLLFHKRADHLLGRRVTGDQNS